MKNVGVIFGLGLWLAWAGCSTDFDLNADFVETPVVYGLLDASDTVHYVRINRAFLSDQTDAITLAQDPSAIYYGDELSVVVEELQFGNVINTFVLSRVDGDTLGFPKDTTGIFASSPNILYRFTATLDQDNAYRLVAVNEETGKEVRATTQIIDDFKITRPNEEAIFPQYFSLSPQGIYQFSFLNARDAALYDLTLRFHYRTARYFQSGDSIQITGSADIDWKWRDEYSTIGRDPNETITVEIPGLSFYNFIAEAFEPDPDIFNILLPDSVQFIVEAGGEEIYNYQLFNNSTLGITGNQVTDAYTNVEGGLGLFSTRFSKTSKIYPLTIQTRDSIGCSVATGDLNFTPDQSTAGFPFCF